MPTGLDPMALQRQMFLSMLANNQAVGGSSLPGTNPLAPIPSAGANPVAPPPIQTPQPTMQPPPMPRPQPPAPPMGTAPRPYQPPAYGTNTRNRGGY